MIKNTAFYCVILALLLILSSCEEKISKEDQGNQNEVSEGCIDTEGALVGFYNQDFKTKGTVTSEYEWETVSASSKLVPFGKKTDSCDGSQLIEYGCEGDTRYTVNRTGYAEAFFISCSEVVGEDYICKNGACIRETGTETTVIADCGGPYYPQLGQPFFFDGTKSQGDIVYYEVSFSDESAEIDKLKANVNDSSEIRVEHIIKEVGYDPDHILYLNHITLMVQDSTDTKDYCQVFFTVSE